MDLAFDQDRPEWTTLAQVQPPRRRRWGFSLVLSAVVHGAVLLVLCWPAAPIFIRPSFIARGGGGLATPDSIMLYLPVDFHVAVREQPLLALRIATRKEAEKAKIRKRLNALDLEKKADSAEAGSTVGSSIEGDLSGDDVKPALPSVF